MGPILCIVETNKINKIRERCYTTYETEIRINNLPYVDDIIGMGSNIKSVIVKVGNKDRGYRGPKAEVSKTPIEMKNEKMKMCEF